MKKEITNVDGKFYEKCKVVMLPTKGISSFGYISETKTFHIYSNNNQFGNPYSLLDNIAIPQHLYILSNEEIKEGDWVIDSENKVRKVLNIIDGRLKLLDIPFLTILPKSCKKIIATTDESLKISLGKFNKDEFGNSYPEFEKFKTLSRPSNEFLKKFCEASGIWKVLVEYEDYDGVDEKGWLISKYKLKVAPDNTITIKPVPEERLYTRYEVIEILNKYHSKFIAAGFASTPFQDWIKENL